MSQHTSPSRPTRPVHRRLPRGRVGLVAFEVAIDLAKAVAGLAVPRGMAHLRDHLGRAADNTVLRLSEAGGRTLGNRYQHLEAAYAETQEVRSDLVLLSSRGVEIPDAVLQWADRLGGLIYGLLRAETRAEQR